MKSVMISIKPKRCELIANGKKTIEVRKTKPKIETPFKCYIYCTQEKYKNKYLHTSNKKNRLLFWHNNGDCEIVCEPEHTSYTAYSCNGKVIGHFVCDGILSHCEMANADIAEQQGKIKREELIKYANGKEVYGWHISDLKIYDEPKELSKFKKINRKCWYADLGIAKRDCPECKNADCFLTSPSQPWCYVEELR